MRRWACRRQLVKITRVAASARVPVTTTQTTPGCDVFPIPALALGGHFFQIDNHLLYFTRESERHLVIPDNRRSGVFANIQRLVGADAYWHGLIDAALTRGPGAVCQSRDSPQCESPPAIRYDW